MQGPIKFSNIPHNQHCLQFCGNFDKGFDTLTLSSQPIHSSLPLFHLFSLCLLPHLYHLSSPIRSYRPKTGFNCIFIFQSHNIYCTHTHYPHNALGQPAISHSHLPHNRKSKSTVLKKKLIKNRLTWIQPYTVNMEEKPIVKQLLLNILLFSRNLNIQ